MAKQLPDIKLFIRRLRKEWKKSPTPLLMCKTSSLIRGLEKLDDPAEVDITLLLQDMRRSIEHIESKIAELQRVTSRRPASTLWAILTHDQSEAAE
jgi:hypothetical protein